MIKYFKNIKIDNIDMTIFIDMGSAPCLMKISVALDHQLDIHYEPIELKSFGPDAFKVKSPGYVTGSVQ